MSLEQIREVSIAAVQAGMDVVRDWRGDLGMRLVPTAGGTYDAYRTAVDDAADIAIRRVLAASATEGDWVVDAVDGTTNLVRGDPFVGLTVALLVDGQPVAGATGCPFTDELWSAARGLGAYDRTERRLRVVPRPRGEWRIALDPAESGPRHRERWNAVHDRLTDRFGGVELRSAISLEFAYVAAGRFDGLVQIGGSPVEDFAAGVLLVREAGGIAEGLRGSAAVWEDEVVLAASPAVWPALKEILK
jgi:myo-inositol-1(or 4)-monophosphatase